MIKKIKFSFIRFLQLLLFLIPITMVTGPFLPDLFLSILVLLFIYVSLKNKLWKYYNNSYFKFFLILNLYLILSSLLSSDPLYSIKTSLFYFRFTFFGLATWYILENSNKEFLVKYVKYIAIFIIFLCVDGIFQSIFKENLFGFAMIENDRVSGLFRDDLILGSYLSRLFPFILSLIVIFLNFKKFDSIVKILFILIVGVGILISGERTSFGIFALSIFLSLFINLNRKVIFSTIFSISVIFLIIILSNERIRYRNFIEPLQQSGVLSDKILEKYSNTKKSYVVEKPVIFSREHTAHYQSALLIFQDHKFFGAGPKMFRHICKEDKYNIDTHACSTHPHNVLLQIISETGIFGLIFYLILVLRIFFRFYNIRQEVNIMNYNFINIMCLITFILNLFPLVPSGNIFNNWISIIFYIPVGFYLYYFNNKFKIKND